MNFYYEEIEPPDLKAALSKLQPLIDEAANSGTMDLIYQKPDLEEKELEESDLASVKDNSLEASHGKVQAEESKNKWIIVDYKTDRVNTAKTGEELLQHTKIYLPQLKVYKEVFEIVTGFKPLIGRNVQEVVKFYVCISSIHSKVIYLFYRRVNEKLAQKFS